MCVLMCRYILAPASLSLQKVLLFCLLTIALSCSAEILSYLPLCPFCPRRCQKPKTFSGRTVEGSWGSALSIQSVLASTAAPGAGFRYGFACKRITACRFIPKRTLLIIQYWTIIPFNYYRDPPPIILNHLPILQRLFGSRLSRILARKQCSLPSFLPLSVPHPGRNTMSWQCRANAKTSFFRTPPPPVGPAVVALWARLASSCRVHT